MGQARRLGYDPLLHPRDEKDGIGAVAELGARLFRKKPATPA